MSWKIKKFEHGFNQFWNIKDAGNTATNVSQYTVTLKVKMGTTLLISGACTLASGTLGYIYYTVQSGDFPYTGKANYELELTTSGVKIVTETYAVHIGRAI